MTQIETSLEALKLRLASDSQSITSDAAYGALAHHLRIVGEVDLAKQLSGDATGGNRIEPPMEFLTSAVKTATKYESTDLLAAAVAVAARIKQIVPRMLPIHDSESGEVSAYIYRG